MFNNITYNFHTYNTHMTKSTEIWSDDTEITILKKIQSGTKSIFSKTDDLCTMSQWSYKLS